MKKRKVATNGESRLGILDCRKEKVKKAVKMRCPRIGRSMGSSMILLSWIILLGKWLNYKVRKVLILIVLSLCYQLCQVS